MRRKERLYRVVTFLKRGELDFLDDLVKDIYFSYGVKISRARLIEEIIGKFKDEEIKSKRELIDKILVAVRTRIERRRYPRLKKNLLLGLRKMDSLEQYKDSVTDNISMGGFKVELPSLDKTLSVNQVVELILKSPEENLEPIKAIGRIKWMREKEDKQGLELGVMLTYIRKEDRERFVQYLNKAPSAKTQIELKRRKNET